MKNLFKLGLYVTLTLLLSTGNVFSAFSSTKERSKSDESEFTFQLHVVNDITFPFEKTSVSDNGLYIAGSALGVGAIHNTETGQTVTFSREGMAGDYVSDVTNDGMVVGRAGTAASAQPAYRMLGEDWVLLPNNSKNGGSAAASSSDGSLLGGHILDEDADNLYRPALWVHNGTDYELVVLPMPEADVQGKAPRGVKVVDISADGSVILGLFEYDFNDLQMIYPLVWTKEGANYTYTELGKSIPEGVLAGGGGVKFFLERGLSLSGDGRYVSVGYTYLDMEVYVMTMFQHIAVFDLSTGSNTFTVLVDPNTGIAPYWFLGDYSGDLWLAQTLNDGTTLASKQGHSPSTKTQGLVYDASASKYIGYAGWILEQTGIDIMQEANLSVSGYPFASADGKIIGGAYKETGTGELKFYYIRRDFVPDSHIITASAVGEGNITPSGEVEVVHGSDQTFTFSANEGYELTNVIIDGVNAPDAVSAGSYTFVNVVEPHTIVAEFEILVYTISASAVGNGTITPSGAVEVEHGSDQTFTFSADEGYKLANVMVDGVNAPDAVSTGSYTFANVVAPHTIVAEFEILVYTISASAVGNGTITPSGAVEVEHGSDQIFTFSADEGYKLANVMVDGVNAPNAVSTGSYTFANVVAPHTIVAEFEILVYTISASAVGNGTITPSGAVEVEHGSDQTFTFSANEGYKLANVMVDGVNAPNAVSAGSYTFANVVAPHTIVAEFEVITYTISASSSEGGAINPTGDIIVNHGENLTFTFTADNDYRLDLVLVDGVNNPEAVDAGSYTFSNIIADHQIEAVFAPISGVTTNGLSQIAVYPNPVADKITISNENHLMKTVVIISLSGKVVRQIDNINSHVLEVDVSYLPRGGYIISVDGIAKMIVKD